MDLDDERSDSEKDDENISNMGFGIIDLARVRLM